MKTLLSLTLFLCSCLAANECINVKAVRYVEGEEITAWGRGVAVDKNHVLTCNHVVDGNIPYVQVKEVWHPAKVVAFDAEKDLCLLEVDVKLTPTDALIMPDIEVHGNIQNNPPKERSARIVAFIMSVDEIENFPNPQDVGGLSGSPVVAEGRLIGMVVAAGRNVMGTTVIAVGPDLIQPFLKEHLK